VLDSSADFTRQGIPADFTGVGRPITANRLNANIFVSAWEIDFFGRIQSLVARALEEYLASQQARRSAQILLVSQVASTYLTLAADREILTLARTTLQTQKDAYDLVKHRLDRGLVPELDLHRAQTQVDSARVAVATWTQLAARDKNALDLLAGSPVPEDLLPVELGSVSAIQEVSPGISSAVLLCRPDIIQAEDLLKAANANIGAARAAFFPRISLTSAIGAGSTELSGLFKSGSMAWNFGPQIVMPIFDPRTWGALKVTEVDQKSAIAQYEKAIQTAFREVADALAVLGTVDQQISAQESLVQAASETYRLSSDRYVRGIDSYLSVLDAQQALYAAQRNLVLLRLERLANQVNLYAVLGGGWQSDPNARASQ
jgi:outer membrane protein, multidrug efflux system